jgi:hypothetical protein
VALNAAQVRTALYERPEGPSQPFDPVEGTKQKPLHMSGLLYIECRWMSLWPFLWPSLAFGPTPLSAPRFSSPPFPAAGRGEPGSRGTEEES